MINYDTFIKKYREQHCCCPKCFGRTYSSTLSGYVYDPEHPENYKDGNSCRCCNCGWKGIRHDLVPDPNKDKL